MAPILHLSLPVTDLAAARTFYEEVLGCRVGRERDDWIDVWFYGMQLTLQHRPDEVLALGDQGCRHFGVALEPADFESVVARLEGRGVHWVSRRDTATEPELSGKTSVKVADPSGNVIELKCYPDGTELGTCG